MISIFSYRGMYFGFYDSARNLIHDYDNLKIWKKFLVAQTITMASETINYPFDTIRRRMMMNSGLEKKLFNNSVDCFKKILKDEGMKGFFKGNFSNMVRSVSSSLVLVLYDEIHLLMAKSK